LPLAEIPQVSALHPLHVHDRQPLTQRIRWLLVSAITKPPVLFSATPPGLKSPALVAGPPSPEKPKVRTPATV
jgi:hypothetical protein